MAMSLVDVSLAEDYARDTERERCAKIVDKEAEGWTGISEPIALACKNIAAKIRKA